jgi:hypothetical protein
MLLLLLLSINEHYVYLNSNCTMLFSAFHPFYYDSLSIHESDHLRPDLKLRLLRLRSNTVVACCNIVNWGRLELQAPGEKARKELENGK